MTAELISLNGRFVTQSVTGVQRYAWEMVKALDRALDERASTERLHLEFELLVPKGYLEAVGHFSNIRVCEVGTLNGHAWEQLDLPKFARGRIINFCNSFPVLSSRPVVVIHDAAVYAMPDGYTRAFVRAYRALYWLLRFRYSTCILTVSEFSRNEIAHYSGIRKDRIKVLYCGADHWNLVIPEKAIIERLNLTNKLYLLAVASANPNKNLDRLIQAYKLMNRTDIPLVLVGGANKRVFAGEAGLEIPGVVRTGSVSDSELAALYSSASAFVFPSLYEGFGLPPLEAMMFGCPVISSRRASLPEVCGDAAEYCDALDPADIARAMREVLANEALRSQIIAAGRKQAKKFKWDTSAQGLLNVIRDSKSFDEH